MGALAEASASDEAANNAGRVSPKLVLVVVILRYEGFLHLHRPVPVSRERVLHTLIDVVYGGLSRSTTSSPS